MKNNQYVTDIDEPLSEVEVDDYYVVIGIEANVHEAYQMEKVTFSNKKEKHQFLSGPNLDWGHAFFYVVKNEEVQCFFSFGPSAGKKMGENRVIGNSATCQYPIGEVAQLYVLKINAFDADIIKSKVTNVYKKTNNQYYDFESEEWRDVNSNDKKYRALTNETCAKEAYLILSAGLGKNKIPDAKGYIKIYGISKNAICPYAWNENLLNSNLTHHIYPEYPNIGKAKELLAAFIHKDLNNSENLKYSYFLRTFTANERNLGVMVPPFDGENTSDWFLVEGQDDPLKVYKYFE